MPTTLANLVKNVDPPVEITQEEYDNLTTEQKNDGTTYYIVDGSSVYQTAATTPATSLSGADSNVQAELDKKLETSRIVNGGSTTEQGYILDARYGKTLTDQIDNLDKYLFYHTQIAKTTSTALSGHTGSTYQNIMGENLTITVPTGYELVKNLYIEVGGFAGLFCFFDGGAKVGSSTFNPFIYNISNTTLPVGQNLSVLVTSVFKKIS